MYVTKQGQTISTVVPGGKGCIPRRLTMRSQRRLLQLRGLGAALTSNPTANPAFFDASNPAATVTQPYAGFVDPYAANVVGPMNSVLPVAAVTPITASSSTTTPGRGWTRNPRGSTTTTPATYTDPTAPAAPGSPVPENFPTSQLFVDSSGNTWQYSSSSGQWGQISTGTTASPSGYYSGTLVPNGTPTNEPYVDSYGNVWIFNAAANSWSVGSSNNAALLAQEAAAAGATTAATVAAPAESDTQSLLDWLSQQTLITGVPNWALAIGVGFIALKLSSGKGR